MSPGLKMSKHEEYEGFLSMSARMLTLTCVVQSDWESLNRNVSGSMFEALQERDDDTHLDDAMVDVAGAPATKKRISKPAEITQNLLADEHADIDVDDDIT